MSFSHLMWLSIGSMLNARTLQFRFVNSPFSLQTLLEQILQIERMEHGSLSIIRQGPNGAYYSLNSWEDGKNHCRYLPQDKVAEVQTYRMDGFWVPGRGTKASRSCQLWAPGPTVWTKR